MTDNFIPPDLENQMACQLDSLGGLIHLQHCIRQAKTPEELSCILVNDTLQLLPYHQAVFWEWSKDRILIKTISGVDQVPANSPYIQFLTKLIPSFAKAKEIKTLSVRDVEPDLADEWGAWLPENLLVCPLNRADGSPMGGLIFQRSLPWSPKDVALLEQVSNTFSHAWSALKTRGQGWFSPAVKQLVRPWPFVLAGLALLLLCWPIHLSVLAPMEIIPEDPMVVAAPMDGAIKEFMVTPSQAVTAGQDIFSLDDLRLRNEHDIAMQTLAVTQADELRARQKAFGDEASRAELLLIKARIKQHRATLSYLAEKLERIRVKAPVSGVVVFNDVNDWLGKPVVVGEKIVTLADPEAVIAQIQLPVADAINLIPGARIRIFLNISPDQPICARLFQAAYEAQLTADNILAFRLKASLASIDSPPRIGLRGTAKIYGEKVSLFYYLFRRPLAFLRQFLGV
ncbi:MAG: HlyD family efflux transporter periplasmic adaptor subunit [Desulfobacteraceae bacterium]|nr:HlyD family efflux transporter periplasmic adaptor subunit [Desulfobacteraceae bacterium]